MKQRNDGFAVVEVLLLLVVIVLIGGVGFWVFTQRASQNKQAQESAQIQDADKLSVTTTTQFNEYLDSVSKEETEATQTSANTLAESAMSDASANNSVGEAYNEASL